MIACEGCYCNYGYKVDAVVRPILWKKVADNDCYCEGSYNSLSVLNGVGVERDQIYLESTMLR